MLSLWLTGLIKVREGGVSRQAGLHTEIYGRPFPFSFTVLFLSSDYSELPLPDLKEVGQFLEDREAGHLDLRKLA